MNEIQGQLDAKGKRFAIVAASFNEAIVARLIDGASCMLRKLGAREEDITLFRVPGAFEIPRVALLAGRSGSFDAVICLGAVIRGATPHFEHVAGESARGIAQAARECPVPVIYGVLTTDTIEQAVERAGTKAGNRGADAAAVAVEMADLQLAIERELGKEPGKDYGKPSPRR